MLNELLAISKRKTMPAAYEDDLAYIHDAGFTDFARDAAPGILALLAQRGIDEGTVVDLGCGSGVWAKTLCNAGYSVVGSDISAAMIAIAKRRVPEGEFHVASFLDFEIPNCRAVTALGEVLNYRFDARNTRAALKRVFRRVHAALEPGGLFVFDLADPGRHRHVSQHFSTGDDWAVLVDFEPDERRARLTRKIVTFREVDGCYRRSDEIHELQLYTPGEITTMLREAGFRVRTSRKYGDVPLFPNAVAYIARKPER